MRDKVFIFNPYYGLKNDRKRIILINSPYFKIPIGLAEEDFTSFIHPIFAIIFSFFDGIKNVDEVLVSISKVLNFPTNELYSFISPFFDNTKRIGIEYDSVFFEFPKRVLIDNTKGEYKRQRLNYKDFVINDEYDFDTYRLYEGPSTISLLLNTICATDCTYCYVDRRIKNNCSIPISRLKKIIREAKQLKVVNFDIAGTEIFLYKHWDELVKELIDNNYYPYLSTKLPISESKIIRLKEIGIKDIQLSIDTVSDNIAKVVNRIDIPNYIDRMFETLFLLEKNQINCAINTVLTNDNNKIGDILNLLNKISSYKNIERVTFNPAERSAYWESKDFDKRKNSVERLEEIEELLNKIRDDYEFDIVFASYSVKEDFINEPDKLLKAHQERSLCSANKEQICILSDGQVTICEELYWNPRFIIGNILEQSIKEVWQSEKALRLENISRNDFSDLSNCKTCREFDNCRLQIGVCWSNVASAYGNENWDFPSPSCPYSPPLKYSMYHE